MEKDVKMMTINTRRSSELAQLKADWMKNVDVVCSLHVDLKWAVKRDRKIEAHQLQSRIQAYATKQHALDHKIQNYHRLKAEFAYNQFNANQ